MTTQDPILAALRGEPAPTGYTTSPGDGAFTTMGRMIVDALESTARQHVRNLIVHEGAAAPDAQVSTDIRLRHEMDMARKAGATTEEAMETAIAKLDEANARHRGRTATGRPHTVAAAEAAAASWTPRTIREIREWN